MSRRKSYSLSTVQVIILLLVLVAGGAVTALLLAPRKPPAPPVSQMSVAERPTEKIVEKKSGTVVLEPVGEAPAPKPEPKPVAAPEPDAVDAVTAFQVLGTVKEKDTAKPIAGVVVLAVRAAGAEQQAECDKRLEAARATNDEVAIAEAQQECDQLTVDQVTYRGVTDTGGAFRIAVADAGDYRLLVPGREELPEQRRHMEKYEAQLGALNTDNKEITHDVLVDLKAAVMGRVTETGGSTPATEVTVTLLDASAKNALGSFVTAEDGTYELSVNEPGEYAVRVDLEKSPYRMGELIPFRRVKLPEPDSILEGIDFEVEPAGIVWGYVTTPKGDPVAESEVVLCTADSPLTQFVTAALRQERPVTGRSQSDGYYELLGVPLGQEWQLYASNDAKAPQLAQPFALSASMRTLRVDVFLFPGSRITGVVVDERGRPVPEARIRCIPSLTSLVTPLETAYAFRDSRADANGMFEFVEVPAGGYSLYAQKQGYKFDTAGVPIYPDGYSELTNVQVTLYPIETGNHEVFGRVVDPEGTGIAGVKVSLNGMALDTMTRTSQETTTSTEGEFRFKNVPSGRYGGIFEKESYATVRRTTLSLDKENMVLMSQATLVRGRVLVRETDQPPAQYSVQAVKTAAYGDGGRTVMGGPAGGDNVGGEFANPDGSFELFLGPGDYQLTASSAELTPGRTFVSVEPGAVVDDVLLYVTQTGGVISGVVKCMDGKSPQGGVAKLVDTSGGLSGVIEGGSPINTEYTLGEDGRFTFEKLPAGNYLITIQHPSYANTSSEPITLGEGETRSDIEITLGRGGVLTGRVCYADGRPWPGAQLFIASPDSATIRDAISDESGNFQVDGLATGQYTVTATSLAGVGMLGGDRMVKSVYVEDGQSAEVDFCAEGIRLTGVCSPPPPSTLGGGQIFLSTPGSPTMGERFDGREEEFLRMVVQGGNSIDGQGFYEIPGLTAGTYQVEVVYFSLIPGGGGGFQSVAVSIIDLDGTQPEVQFDPVITAE